MDLHKPLSLCEFDVQTRKVRRSSLNDTRYSSPCTGTVSEKWHMYTCYISEKKGVGWKLPLHFDLSSSM